MNNNTNSNERYSALSFDDLRLNAGPVAPELLLQRTRRRALVRNQSLGGVLRVWGSGFRSESRPWPRLRRGLPGAAPAETHEAQREALLCVPDLASYLYAFHDPRWRNNHWQKESNKQQKIMTTTINIATPCQCRR